jgi:hypothetical protein
MGSGTALHVLPSVHERANIQPTLNAGHAARPASRGSGPASAWINLTPAHQPSLKCTGGGMR